MTRNEVKERYRIPIEILREYEKLILSMNIKNADELQYYDDSDIERISMIMTLHEIGFFDEEVKEYMYLLLEEKTDDKNCIEMLNIKRRKMLDEIHVKQNCLDRLDYLRFELRKKVK